MSVPTKLAKTDAQDQQTQNQQQLKKQINVSARSTPDFTQHVMRHHTVAEQLKQASAGAISAFFTRSITQPLDVLKIRFQLQVEPVRSKRQPNTVSFPSKYTSILQATRLIANEEGMRAFWKGHNAGQLMSISYGIMQFWTYEQVQFSLVQQPLLSQHGNLASFVSGSVAGCTATFVSMPFDVIRTRQVAQDHNAPEGYRNIVKAFPTILRTEGVRGLFRGLLSTMLQIGPLVGANFMFYHHFNDFAKEALKPEDAILPTWCLLMTGAAAGVASKSVVYPLDFIKKRLQLTGFERHRQTFGANQRCTGIINCIQLTLKNEGTMGFYKGMAPTLLKSGMTTALYFSIYDRFKQMFLHEGLEA